MGIGGPLEAAWRMILRGLGLLVVCTALVAGMPLGHEDSLALLEEGASPYMRKAVNDFQASVDRVHGSEGEVEHALSNDFADDNEVSKSLVDLEEDAEDIGESSALPVATPAVDYSSLQEEEEEKSLEKASKLAKRAATKDTKEINQAIRNVKTQAEIKKMADDAQAKITTVLGKAGITSEQKLGESKMTSSYDQITKPTTSYTSKYTSKYTAPTTTAPIAEPTSYEKKDDNAEIEKLDALKAKLQGNLAKTEKSMTTVEKTFEKNTVATQKMKKEMDSFKAEAEKANSIANSVTGANDELGDASSGDMSHEMDKVVQMTKKSGAVGVSREAARHLEEDYHQVASKYVKNLQNIMNEWKTDNP